MQTSVVRVAEKVPSSVPTTMLNKEGNGSRTLLSIDCASVSVNIPKSDRDKSNDYYEQLSSEKKRSFPKRTKVVCSIGPCKNTFAKKVHTVIAIQSADQINSDVGIEETAMETMPTAEDYMQSCVVGVLREVSQTFVHCSATSVNEIGEFQI